MRSKECLTLAIGRSLSYSPADIIFSPVPNHSMRVLVPVGTVEINGSAGSFIKARYSVIEVLKV
jgi:hypothetical protein